jgi:hypothetical protein
MVSIKNSSLSPFGRGMKGDLTAFQRAKVLPEN